MKDGKGLNPDIVHPIAGYDKEKYQTGCIEVKYEFT